MSTSKQQWEATKERMRIEALEKDAARLDKLNRMRRHYSRPPMRAVTGWEWSVVSEHGDRLFAAENVRSAIDNMEEPT